MNDTGERSSGVKHIFHSVTGDKTLYEIEPGDTVFCGGQTRTLYIENGELHFDVGRSIHRLNTEVFMVKKKPIEDYSI